MNVTDLQNATIAARSRTGDDRIGTYVKKGLFSVVTVEYVTKPKRKTLVNVLSGDLSLDAAVAYLDGLA